VLARWNGGVKEFPAIVVAMTVHEEVEVYNKLTKAVRVTLVPLSCAVLASMYALCVSRLADGASSRGGQRDVHV
jgi:hypothetical protein